MNKKKREGDFYATKVRQYLNEYDGINLEDFCKAEKVSYSKMCNCLGRPSYRRPSHSTPTVPQQKPSLPDRLPQMDLAPLVIDYPENHEHKTSSEEQPIVPGNTSPSQGIVTDVSIRLSGRIDLCIGKCRISTLVSLMKEMEVKLC